MCKELVREVRVRTLILEKQGGESVQKEYEKNIANNLAHQRSLIVATKKVLQGMQHVNASLIQASNAHK